MGLKSLWPRGLPRTSHPGRLGSVSRTPDSEPPSMRPGHWVVFVQLSCTCEVPLINGLCSSLAPSICGWSKWGTLKCVSWHRSREAGMEPGSCGVAVSLSYSNSSWGLNSCPGHVSRAKGQMDPVSA